jgi:hypothetical protein
MKGSLIVKKMRSYGGRHDVNKDPRKLDHMYIRLLGPEGPKLLSEESRWLAVTHKSFDHGRRGFNDRLSFLGMYGHGRLASNANNKQAEEF